MSFLKNLSQAIEPVTPAKIIWLVVISILLFMFFFYLGFQYSAAQGI
ncbi:hypothetical protein [Aquimarina sediminis]|nr:hypothetical protein [Aquimarina sediminis]